MTSRPSKCLIDGLRSRICSHPHPCASPSRITTVLVLLLGCFAGPLHAVDVTKSPNDDRHYRYLQLPNELRVLLISDPGADKAAAALDVFVGSIDDPPDRQGLAHFLEHMLFLGTEKYPDADEYQTYINEHGGSHNAYTSFEHTSYFFDINSEYLEPALDRFAQFFIAPLFSAEYVERERNAVHSEYQSRLNDEHRRTLDVYRQLMNPKHPLTKFSIGSLDTLSNGEKSSGEIVGGEQVKAAKGGRKLRQDLLDFYRRHYKAETMGLVVLGRENLDQLEKMVESRFVNVPGHDALDLEEAKVLAASAESPSNGGTQDHDRAEKQDLADSQPSGKGEAPSDFLEPLFLSGDLPMRVSIRPQKELRQLSLLFPIPPVKRLYRRKPDHYLSNLLGHEGEGSFLAVLKSQGWAQQLSAGPFLSTEHSALFQVNITLTKLGLLQWQSVAGLAFAKINRIARNGIEEWRFAELQRLGEIAFRFQEKSLPRSTVTALASNLHYYKPEDVIAGDYLLQEYDPDLIKHFSAFLNPGRAVVAITAPGVETEQLTPYFATPYSVDSAPVKLAELSTALINRLQLPAPNPFIPQDLNLKSPPVSPSGLVRLAAAEPQMIKNAARTRVWFKHDDQFDVPRATTFLRIKSPEAANSLRGATLMRLYVAMVRNGLSEYSYPASLAGLHYSLQANSRGLDVMVAGYNDGQDRLFQRIIEQMHTPRFSGQQFDVVRNALLREWQNAVLDPPYRQLMDAMPTLLFSPWWSQQEHIDTLAEISFDDLKQFVKRAFVDSRAEILLYGNMTRSEAAKLAGLVEVELLTAMADKTLPAAQVVKLESLASPAQAPVFAKPVSQSDDAVVLYLQGRDDTSSEKAYSLLLQQIMRSPFFHQLRTEQQLGYVVSVSAMPFKDVPGTVFVVQSPAVSADALMKAIETFLGEALKLVPDSLAQHKSAVVTGLLESPKNLQDQANRYWESITHNDDAFKRRERLAEAVMAIEADELSAYFRSALVEQPRALWLLATSDPLDGAADGGEEQSNWMPISQWPSFKAERESYVYP